MKKLKDKVNIAGKAVPVFILALFLMGGTALAAVLSVYGTISGTATVEQSVILAGSPITYSYTTTGGNTEVSGTHVLTNNAEIQATVELETLCSSNPYHASCNEMTTTYRGVLELTTKNIVEPNKW